MVDLPPVTFATLRIEREFHELARRNSLLYGILDDAAEHAVAAAGWIPRIGDIWRTPQEAAANDAKSVAPGGLGMGRAPGTPSPHCYWLAADILIRGVPPAAVAELDAWINATWIYDPSRPEMRVSDCRPHGTGPHMHLQARPGVTVRRLAA